MPGAFESEARVYLGFQPFPIHVWLDEETTEEHLFDFIEFMFDRVAKPGGWVPDVLQGGEYRSFDEDAGRADFRQAASAILADWKSGYELSEIGEVESRGSRGLQYLFAAEIPHFDEANVDSKVRMAIAKWRNRHAKITDKREAVRILADVFEYLKTAHHLEKVLDSKDSSLLFNLVNNFAIRHHAPAQKSNYDPAIWLAWMFHFYLATYHASVRLLLKKRGITVSLIAVIPSVSIECCPEVYACLPRQKIASLGYRVAMRPTPIMPS